MTLQATAAGAGPLLVLVHGWGLNSRVWDSVVPQLSRHFTVVCLDMPGHGSNQWPPHFHDIDSLADRIGQPIETAIEAAQAGLGQEGGCLLLGWSLGAMAAIALASKRRDLVRRLVLVAATPKFVRSHDWPSAVEESALRGMAERLMTDFQATVRDFLLWQVHGDENARPALKTLRAKVKAGGSAHPEALRAGLAILATVDLRPRLAELEIPTLVLSGERDRLAPPQAGAALAAALPQARFHLIKHAAHAPFLSHTEEFCLEVIQFLAT